MAYSSLSLRRASCSSAGMAPRGLSNRAMRPKVSNNVQVSGTANNSRRLSWTAPAHAAAGDGRCLHLADRKRMTESAGKQGVDTRPAAGGMLLRMQDKAKERAVATLSEQRKPTSSRAQFAHRHDKYRLRERRTMPTLSFSSPSPSSSKKTGSIQTQHTPDLR